METLAGRNSVREALVAGRRRFERVMLAEHVSEQGLIREILELCRAARIPVSRVPRHDLDQLGDELTHQGVVAQVSPYPYVDMGEILGHARSAGGDPLLLVLDELQDPQNVGALLRTADAVGVHGVVIGLHRAAQITPAVSRASAGAAEHLLICAVTNIAKTLQSVRGEGLWIAGVEDYPEAQDYRQADLQRPLALVLGSEGQGLRRLVAKQCDYLLRIPMRGRINSLNVSVAGALVLYEALRARDRT
ncbi:MAG: 23S rRNA (guanosine(2251)-2'-O)-methyltransferase RlmB [Anaerolineae bacterium]